jgi:hypothetical protein
MIRERVSTPGFICPLEPETDLPVASSDGGTALLDRALLSALAVGHHRVS